MQPMKPFLTHEDRADFDRLREGFIQIPHPPSVAQIDQALRLHISPDQLAGKGIRHVSSLIGKALGTTYATKEEIERIMAVHADRLEEHRRPSSDQVHQLLDYGFRAEAIMGLEAKTIASVQAAQRDRYFNNTALHTLAALLGETDIEKLRARYQDHTAIRRARDLFISARVQETYPLGAEFDYIDRQMSGTGIITGYRRHLVTLEGTRKANVPTVYIDPPRVTRAVRPSQNSQSVRQQSSDQPHQEPV